MKLTLPNIFTISRAILAPVFMVLLLTEGRVFTLCAVVVFIIAAITDYLDGWVARKRGESSAWGTLVDPLADKVLTTAAFVAFALQGRVEWWMVSVVTVRDIATTLFRTYADAIGKPLVTSFGAKMKTFVQMTFIIIVLVLLAMQTLPLPAWMLVLPQYGLLTPIVSTVMLLVTIITVWTGAEYFVTNRTVARRICLRVWVYTLRFWLKIFPRNGAKA
jgi:CDP-diacylglycerol---glycerol-3-phosphate 3-phosphatidyltransferase